MVELGGDMNGHSCGVWWSGAAIVLATCATFADADTIVWTGNAQTLGWGDAQNWSPALVPGVDMVGADVVIQQASGIVQGPGQWITLGDLQAESSLALSFITLTMNTAYVRDLILQQAATLNVTDIIFDGTTQWRYGFLTGPLGSPAVNQGLLLLPTGVGTGTKEIRRKTFMNVSDVQQFSGLAITDDGEVRNHSQWSLYNNNSNVSNPTPALGDAVFKNLGTLTRTAPNPPGGSASSAISIPFENSGSVVVDGLGAEISFTNAGKLGGSYSASGGGRVWFSPNGNTQSLEGSANVTGVGEVRIASGTFHIKPGATLTASLQPFGSQEGLHINHGGQSPVVIDGALNNQGYMRWSAGPLQGQGDINNSGLLLLAGGSPLHVDLTTLSDGHVHQTSHLSVGSNTTINLHPGSTWTMAGGNLGLVSGAVNTQLVVSGLFRRQDGQGNLSVSLPLLLLDGTVRNNGPGLLWFTNGGTLAGNGVFQPGVATAAIMLDGVQGDIKTYRVTGTPRAASGIAGVWIGPYAELKMDGGSFTNNGSMFIQGAITGAVGELINQANLSFGQNASIGTASNPTGVVRNLNGVWIDGTTIIRGTLINEDVAPVGVDHNEGKPIHLYGTIENKGYYFIRGNNSIQGLSPEAVFHNRAGGRFYKIRYGTTTVTASFNNEGTVEIEGGGTLSIQLSPQISNGVVSGGTWIVHPFAILNLPGGITHIANPSKIVLKGGQITGLAPTTIGPGAEVEIGAPYSFPPGVNSGIVRVSPAGELNTTGPLENQGGTVNLEGDGRLNINGPLNNTINEKENILGEIQEVFVPSVTGGEPMITATVLNNAGVLRPGGANAAGPFNLTGHLHQLSTGILEIELGGTAPVLEHDRFRIVSGDVQLDGTLAISLLGEFVPKRKQAFEIMVLEGAASTGTISGAFNHVANPEGHVFSLAYHSDRVVAVYEGASGPVNPADLNNDGRVDVLDLLLLLGAWGVCPPFELCLADLNGSGSVDVQDLLILLSNWG
ncbi:MAG TPA: hypothetical protein PK400_10585 [Phycisphaerales bacterium]|nr:hypothetical protein [Phycisphaerales bacterium]HRQ76942.1 hypothetical protein [Phycisphaerales bacterium]